MSFRSIVVIALLLLAPAPAAPSQPAPQDLKRLTIEQLMQIDVTLAARRPEPIATAPTAISVVTGDDIRRAGVTTLADAVALVDGVHVARFNNGTWSVTARGFAAVAANKMLVMIDGRTVYSPLFTGVFWNALDYELEDIDRIEVVRGPGATLWGANAVDGVINIVTRSSRDTPGVFVQAGSGNEDPADAEIRYGGRAGGAAYRAYAKYVVRDSQRFSTGASAGDRRRRGQAGVRFDGGNQAGDTWLFKADLFHSIDGLPDRPDGEFTIGDLHGAWTRSISPQSQLRVASYLNHEYRRIPLQLTHRLTMFDVDVQESTTLTRHAVVWGGGFLAWDIVQFRQELQEDIDAQAAIVADNSAAPLTFNDTQAAGETLAVLRLRPRVTMACLYKDGEVFASYRRNAGATCPPSPSAHGAIGRDAYTVISPVTVAGGTVGTLYISRDLGDLAERLRIGAAAVVAFLLIALGASFLIARRIQHVIAAPLLELAGTARTISTGQDDSVRVTPTSNDEVGVVIQAFNAMLDRISERNSELSRANRLKDEFLATLSHEMRTPLGAVLGWTRVLQTTRAEGATRERALEAIERNARAQARLIEDLLEISRIVTGKLSIHVQPVDLANIIDAAVEVVRPAAAAKRITLTAEIGVRPAVTSGDPDRLQQIIWNLLSNAVKFTGPGGAARIRLTRTTGYRIVVTDTGQGIDPQFLPHVFDAFRQADGTTTREHGGLGLGLAIARQLVELHGGTIKARSDGVGRGSTFQVDLPSVVGESTAGSEVGAPSRHAGTTQIDRDLLRDVRVLVVDDEADARDLIEMALSQYGAIVTTADSAAAALAEIDRRVPDVLLSDVGMPREDGYDLIRRLRGRPLERGGGIPAIAVTAYASAKDRESALASGYEAHVAKPFEPEALAQTVAMLWRAQIRPS